MAVDAQLMAWYARLGREFAPMVDAAPASRRQRYEEITDLLMRLQPLGGSGSAVAAIAVAGTAAAGTASASAAAPSGSDKHVGTRDFHLALPGRTLNARLYHPGGTPALLVFFHGGGWVAGSIHSHQQLCMHVAARSGVAVLSVEYRLAPEHRFPAPVDDAFDALVWAAAHGDELACDVSRLAVGGDSAGAHMAAVTAITARDRGAPKIAYQWLIYPVIDPASTLPSRTACAAGPGLTADDMTWFWQQLGLDQTAQDYRVAPSRAASLAGLPPAYVLTAEADLLRDEGELYAAQLKQAGVAVTTQRGAGMTHGFARLFPVSKVADALMDQAIAALAQALRTPPASKLAQAPGPAQALKPTQPQQPGRA